MTAAYVATERSSGLRSLRSRMNYTVPAAIATKPSMKNACTSGKSTILLRIV